MLWVEGKTEFWGNKELRGFLTCRLILFTLPYSTTVAALKARVCVIVHIKNPPKYCTFPSANSLTGEFMFLPTTYTYLNSHGWHKQSANCRRRVGRSLIVGRSELNTLQKYTSAKQDESELQRSETYFSACDNKYHGWQLLVGGERGV